MRERKSGEGILLENREVVAIVVGSLVVLGIVFYLGVSVGRGLPREEAPVARTLEVLDKEAEQPPPTELTFPERLTDADPILEEQVTDAEEEAKAAEAKAAEAKAAEAKAAEAKAAEAKAAEAKAAEAKAAEAKAAEAKAAEAKAAEAKAAEAKAAGFTVQLASFPQREEARGLVRSLGQAGLAAQVVEATIPGRGTYYRVRVGRFSSREEANAYLDDLKREGRDGIVMPVDG